MDHLTEKGVHPQASWNDFVKQRRLSKAFLLDNNFYVQEWIWYNQHIVDYIQKDMELGARFGAQQIERAIGMEWKSPFLKVLFLKDSSKMQKSQIKNH
jgi:hypothetical protein